MVATASRINNLGSQRAFAVLIVYSMLVTLFGVFPADVQASGDLVPTDDLSGGASVFVFRKSRKQPQERGAVKSFRSAAGAVKRRESLKAQIETARKRKAEQARARAAAIARARARERNARLKLSNTLAERAEAQMSRGEIAGAMVNFRESLKLNPANKEAAEGLSSALTAFAIETAGPGNNAAAIPYLEEAVKLDPQNAAAYAKLGDLYDAAGQNEKALTAYRNAVRLDPEFTAVYLPFGLALAEAGNAAEAEEYLAKAKAAGFESPESRLAYALILADKGRYAEALEIYDQIIATEPGNAAAWYQKGAVLAKSGDLDKAVAAYRQAVALEPTLASAWFDLGVILFNRDDYNGALTAYQRVVELEPQNYRAQFYLASTFRLLERYQEANAHYKLAEPGFKNNPDLYSEWGFCLGKTNEWDKSIERLNTARELSPGAVDNNNTGWGYYNAARADKAAKRDQQATVKLELGKQYLEKAIAEDPAMEAAYLNLGATNNSLGDFEAAAKYLKKALELNRDWIIAINQLGLAYRGANDLSNALAMFQRATTLDGNNVFGLYNLGEVYYLTGNKKEARKVQDRLQRLNPAMAGRLGDVLSGKIAIDAAKQKIESKVPKIPRIPF
jgi:tetratricopeptide (TPR) repeat protein